MERTLMQALRNAFYNQYLANNGYASSCVAIEHVRALDVMIKADIQKEIDEAGEALNAKWAIVAQGA